MPALMVLEREARRRPRLFLEPQGSLFVPFRQLEHLVEDSSLVRALNREPREMKRRTVLKVHRHASVDAALAHRHLSPARPGGRSVQPQRGRVEHAFDAPLRRLGRNPHRDGSSHPAQMIHSRQPRAPPHEGGYHGNGPEGNSPDCTADQYRPPTPGLGQHADKRYESPQRRSDSVKLSSRLPSPKVGVASQDHRGAMPPASPSEPPGPSSHDRIISPSTQPLSEVEIGH